FPRFHDSNAPALRVLRAGLAGAASDRDLSARRVASERCAQLSVLADVLRVRGDRVTRARCDRRRRAGNLARASLQPAVPRRLRPRAVPAPRRGPRLMQDQGKRLLITVGVVMAVLMVWNMLFAPKDAGQNKPAQTQGSAVATAPAAPQFGVS